MRGGGSVAGGDLVPRKADGRIGGQWARHSGDRPSDDLPAGDSVIRRRRHSSHGMGTGSGASDPRAGGFEKAFTVRYMGNCLKDKSSLLFPPSGIFKLLLLCRILII